MKTNKFARSFTLIFSLILTLVLLIGCAQNKDNVTENNLTSNNTIKVGVCAGPYEDMFREAIEPALKEKSYTVQYVQFSDYVQPNQALAAGEIDVNIFQHSVYLKNFSAEHNLDLTYITEVPTAGMGIFANGLEAIDDVPDGAMVAIPNDVTNLARAIRVLEQTGLIKIDPAIDSAEATQHTVVENPKNLTFIEIEAPQLPRSLDSADLAVINGNFAIGAGLNLSDALYNEVLQEGYINVIAVRTEDKDEQFAQDIISIVHSDVFRSVIEDASKQYSSFFRPNDYNN